MSSIQEEISRQYNTFLKLNSPTPYQVNTSGDDTFIRWSPDNSNPVFIQKINASGNDVTITYTISLWGNRSTATYYNELFLGDD